MSLTPKPTPPSFTNNLNSTDIERVAPRLFQIANNSFLVYESTLAALQSELQAFMVLDTNRWAYIVNLTVLVNAVGDYEAILIYAFDEIGVQNS